MGREGAEAARPTGIAIVGPTASGKTELAIAVAERVGGEIISMDSRQAYRGLQAGTAAPTHAERARVPHHGVGFLEPDERYGAGRFVERCTGWMAEIAGRGRVPVLAGGTGLFLRALTHPMFREPPADPGRREALGQWLEALDPDESIRWATRMDPELARRSSSIDAQRAARTLELALLSGRPLSWWIDHGEPARPPEPLAIYAIEQPRDELRKRIRERTARMLEAGDWAEEVRALAAAGREDDRAMDAIGYRDVLALTRGELAPEEAADRIITATWAYARRQRTWFRHQLPAGAVRVDGRRPTDHLARRIAREWSEARGEGSGTPPPDRSSTASE